MLKKIIPEVEKSKFRLDYRQFLEIVYSTQGNSKAVFVDGVKSISRIITFLSMGARVDGIIHLIRNPNDFVKSTMKQSKQDMGVLIKSSLNWRFYHYKASCLQKSVSYLPASYEVLTNNSDQVLMNIFHFLDVKPMMLKDLQPNFKHTWHFMGNVSLFQFDGRIRQSRYILKNPESRSVRFLTGRMANYRYYKEHVDTT
jgi:hypothetical protein